MKYILILILLSLLAFSLLLWEREENMSAKEYKLYQQGYNTGFEAGKQEGLFMRIANDQYEMVGTPEGLTTRKKLDNHE